MTCNIISALSLTPLTSDYRFSVVSGYVSTAYLTKTVYKTLTKAQKGKLLSNAHWR